MMYYTERGTNIIYEVRPVGDTEVLIRPAAPGYEGCIEKLNLPTFAGRFDEFFGDPEEVNRTSQNIDLFLD